MKRVILFTVVLFFVSLSFSYAYYGDTSSLNGGVKEREVVITPAPSTYMDSTTHAYADTGASTAKNGAFYEENYAGCGDYENESVGTQFKNGVVAVGKYSWLGIKNTAIFIGHSIYKGGHYMKVGTISFLETIGVKANPDEIQAHEDILNIANKTLIESRTKREYRMRQLSGSEE